MKNISCSINICLQYFMIPTKTLFPPFPRPPEYFMDGPLWSGSCFLITSDFFRLVHCLVQSSLHTESNLHHHFLDLLLIFLFYFFFLFFLFTCFFFTFADTFLPFRIIYVWSTAIDGYLIAWILHSGNIIWKILLVIKGLFHLFYTSVSDNQRAGSQGAIIIFLISMFYYLSTFLNLTITINPSVERFEKIDII